jgi:hypothetical protein
VTSPLLHGAWITKFHNKSAMTLDTGFSVTDPQLFLFDATGFGIYMNDEGNGLAGQSFLEAGDPLGPLSAGSYYLAIGWWDNEPFSPLGRIFEEGTGTNGPDPVGGGAAIDSWNDDVIGRLDQPTAYQIALTGVGGAAEPAVVLEPSSLALLGAGLSLALIRMRRRRCSK